MDKKILPTVIWKEGEYYISQCLSIDVSSFGKTKKEALINLQDALELYFEDAPFHTAEVRNPSIVSVAL